MGAAVTTRIGTWNLECGGRTAAIRERQRARVRDIVADVMVYTEPGPELSVAAVGRLTSPADRPLSNGAGAWVSISGDGVAPVGAALPYRRMAAVGRTRTPDGAVVVYGSVLPWLGIVRQAPDLVELGETYAEAFARVLVEQVADVRGLIKEFPNATVVWAGDFNQSLVGANYGGSTAGRTALRAAFAGLGFTAWNAGSPHAKAGMSAIDLVCGPVGAVGRGVERIAPDGLSDHAGYIVTIDDRVDAA